VFVKYKLGFRKQEENRFSEIHKLVILIQVTEFIAVSLHIYKDFKTVVTLMESS
jgi:hypothetical protein